MPLAARNCTGGTEVEMQECCSKSRPCHDGQGDCDYNEHCAGELICGRSNCGPEFPYGMDCCVKSTDSDECLSSKTILPLTSPISHSSNSKFFLNII